jgi:hypothetical protein
MTDEKNDSGATEQGSGPPSTPTEPEASPTATGQDSSDAGGQVPGERDQADSASGTDV